MHIEATIIGRSGTFKAVYDDVDAVADFAGKKIKAARAYCFIGDKLVIVFESEKNYWNYPGGGLEPDESVEDGIRREVMEETNMKVLEMKPIGLQEAHINDEIERYVRFACIVQPVGDFAQDPGAEVTRIDIVEPEKAFALADAHWAKIGRRMLERALEFRKSIR